jgi:NAD(P)H dehydrogenase (quinone)
MILVSGANGRLGREIVNRLLAATDPSRLAASTRDPAAMEHAAARGVSVRRADFDDADLTARAFEGAGTLMMISTHDANDIRLRQHKNAIDAAKRAGVRRIVYTSFARPEPANPFSFAALHRRTEEYIAASGIPHTILRNGSYANSLERSLPGARATGRIEWPSVEGKVAYVARADIADAAAAVLCDASHAGSTNTLTGPVALGANELARLIGERIGREVEIVAIPEADYVKKLHDAGAPEYAVESAVTAFRSIAQGFLADVTGDVERLTGHKPARLQEVLAGIG